MTDLAIMWDKTDNAYNAIGGCLPSRYGMRLHEDGTLTLHTTDGATSRAWYLDDTDVVVVGINSVRCWTLATWLTMVAS
jgi:hypothetical protein